MSHLLTIQDLSCVGRCSLSVALPVLSAMGNQCSVLPTAVLSTHTGFPAPEALSLTASIDAFSIHWLAQGIGFDAISVGYLADPAQAEAVKRLLSRFPCPTVIDPVLGDNGRPYRGITPAHITAMKALCARGDVLLPNVTEAALLTGLPYREAPDTGYLRELAQELPGENTQGIVITGVPWSEGEIGCFGLSREHGEFVCRERYIPRSLHGTGDLFSAVVLGALARKKDLPQASALACAFTRRVVEATPEATPMGASFEACLPWLWEQL